MVDERYRRQVFGFTIKRVARFAPWLSPDDVYQETIVAFMEKVEEGNFKATGNVRSMLYGIVRNRVANGRRCKCREKIDDSADVEDLETIQPADGSSKRPGLERAILEGVMNLSPAERRALLHWLQFCNDEAAPTSHGDQRRQDRGHDDMQKSIKRRKEAFRKARDRGRLKLRNHLKRLRHWP